MAERCTVLIIGGGPAGLAAALELHKLGVRGVRVVEREAEAGGVPRLCHHTGFGWGDWRRLYSGPAYAQVYRQRTRAAGVDVQTSTMVTGWVGPRAVTVTSPTGIRTLEADAVLLATGCRERPAAARLTAGDRPLGVFTTRALQHFGRRAVVVGAELVSLSAVLTLAGAGVEVAAMVTEHPHHQIYFPFSAVLWYALHGLGVKLITKGRVSRLDGHRRLEAVEYTHVESGEVAALACDSVIFSGGWIPEHELARSGGLLLDRASLGPQVDTGMHASAPGVFAAGNLLRGAQTADQAALEGRRAAHSIAQFLRGSPWPQGGSRIEVEPPLAWVTPNWVSPAIAARETQFVFQTTRFAQRGEVQLYQGDQLLLRRAWGQLMPNRPYYLAGHWLSSVAGEGAPLRLVLAE